MKVEFAIRNFYRNIYARTRNKPDSSLWSIWFGGGNLIWGLVIAPVFRNNGWTNDVSEIRRANYKYWTIGHILSTGLIDPKSNCPLKFENVQSLMVFYKSVLKRISNSKYEQEFCEFYIDYINKSSTPLDEPFLIPEFRYAGLESKHKYRLDFTILNPHTFELIGIELSPISTHIAVKGISSKTQKQINLELEENWASEMNKRNEYYSTFGITTITFTDSDLKDIAACFKRISGYLSSRPTEVISLKNEIDRIFN